MDDFGSFSIVSYGERGCGSVFFFTEVWSVASLAFVSVMLLAFVWATLMDSMLNVGELGGNVI